MDLHTALHEQDFALIARGTEVEVLRGRGHRMESFEEAKRLSIGSQHPTLVVVPYRVLNEVGLSAIDDGYPILVLESLTNEAIDQSSIQPSDAQMRVDGYCQETERDYAMKVERVIKRSIAEGDGSNFVISRESTGRLRDFNISVAMDIFARLLRDEKNAYWTFLVGMNGTYIVGASPERHIRSDSSGNVTMNPVSGTCVLTRENSEAELDTFLNSEKERDELDMVLDEELKIMSRVCDQDIRVEGPLLQQMSHVVHTGCLLHGRSTLGPWEILGGSFLAPTVVGGPLERAARIVSDVEMVGRGYYAGVIALIEPAQKGYFLDSAIMIRTTEIQADGQFSLRVGATITRDSRPLEEAKETDGKAAAVLRALGVDASYPALTEDPQSSHSGATQLSTGPGSKLAADLAARSVRWSPFWLSQHGTDKLSEQPRVLVLDAEDRFTSMLAYILRTLGADVRIEQVDQWPSLTGYDLVVLGPGPGDPNECLDPRIAAISGAISKCRTQSTPMLCVCLSHQVLCSRLGLPVARLPVSRQGSQVDINLFGAVTAVGLYNSYAARLTEAPDNHFEYSVDPSSGEVFAIRGKGLVSLQFHPESVLTYDGAEILSQSIRYLLSQKEREQSVTLSTLV